MDIQRFLNNKTIEDRGYLTPCWIWQGCKDKDGYGVADENGIKTTPHRLAFKIAYPDLYLSALYILHKCDTRACFNHEHLFQGTAKDNAQDCINKGRHTMLRRTHCKNGHELTENNTYTRKNRNERRCKICALAQNNKYKKSIGR